MSRSRWLVGLLWRWHRRTGLLIFLFILLMAVTGVMLNHTTGLGLDQRLVYAAWLQDLYGDSPESLPAYRIEEQWLSRAVNGRLYLDTLEVGTCAGDLVGAVHSEGNLVVACDEELLLLTREGQLIESINGSIGLPLPVSGLGLSEEGLVLRTGDSWRVADLNRLVFERQLNAGVLVSQPAPGTLPAAIHQGIPAPERWLTWERVLLDLHSGRLFGQGGVLFMDIVALLLVCIASSGLTLWIVHKGRRKRRGTRA